MIDAKTLSDAFISGANNIQNNRQRVDSLNVFPVPDGDTGTNMSMTMGNAKKELWNGSGDTVGEVAHTAASALLRGARGNSGVITSLLFRGFSKGLKKKETAAPADLVEALEIGVAAAYKAVMKPTEGTILTVARVAAEKSRAVLTDEMTVPEVWRIIVDAAKEALAETPEQLPVLKKAGVVDAGGQGLVFIFEGMQSVFEGCGVIPAAEGEETAEASESEEAATVVNAAGEVEEVDINNPYCTEFIVLRDDKNKDPLTLRAYLESIGDCVVVVDDEDIIKSHVHTKHPGLALEKAAEFGMLTKLKIENMVVQHEEQVKAARAQKKTPEAVAIDPETPYGFVAVAAGEGVRQLFLDLGVQQVVSGGQTMNPSTDDILSAVRQVPSADVFVLPNNKNIIMAAEQAAKLSDKEGLRRVHVIPTTTIPQGLTAMLSFDGECDADQNAVNMTDAAGHVETGSVTFAARDSDYDGHTIKEGELLALENGKVSFTGRDLNKVVAKLTQSLLHKDSSFVTLLYGEDVTKEQAEEAEAAIRKKLPEDVELTVAWGGQPVYYYIVSVE